MVGKIIAMFFKVLGFVLAFWLLTYLIISSFADIFNDYDIFNTEDTPAIVTEKFSKNSLTGKPTYFVIVDLNEVGGHNGVENKVFGWQFKQLEVGDEVKGHHIHGEHFFTTLDIVTDSFVIIFLMIFLLFILAALLFWPIGSYLEKKEAKFKSHPLNKPKQRNKVLPRHHGDKVKPRENKLLKMILPKKVYRSYSKLLTMEIILLAMLGIALLFVSSFVMNGFQKFSPIGKTVTEALIVDKDSDSEIYYYIGEVSDPYFALEVIFPDDDGEMRTVEKEVVKSVYEKYEVGESISISYIKWNLYNIFVRDFSFWGFIQTMSYVRFMFYVSIIIGLSVFVGVRVSLRKKRKEKRK